MLVYSEDVAGFNGLPHIFWWHLFAPPPTWPNALYLEKEANRVEGANWFLYLGSIVSIDDCTELDSTRHTNYASLASWSLCCFQYATAVKIICVQKSSWLLNSLGLVVRDFVDASLKWKNLLDVGPKSQVDNFAFTEMELIYSCKLGILVYYVANYAFPISIKSLASVVSGIDSKLFLLRISCNLITTASPARRFSLG